MQKEEISQLQQDVNWLEAKVAGYQEFTPGPVEGAACSEESAKTNIEHLKTLTVEQVQYKQTVDFITSYNAMFAGVESS